MPTNSPSRPLALFLFAHQDDEFGVFQQLLEEQKFGRKVICAYLTDGAGVGGKSARRNRESLIVLRSLGIESDAVIFAGEALGIGDAKLPHYLDQVEAWLRKSLRKLPGIESIYVPAWEGGHHDHDALHAVTVSVADEMGMLGSVRQFALYNGYRCPGSFFRVLKPLVANGRSQKIRISMGNRLRFLRCCLGYPSQRLSWIGLFPFVVLHYLFNGEQELQPVSVNRFNERPHEGILYYEKRAFFSWAEMKMLIDRWKKAAEKPAAKNDDA